MISKNLFSSGTISVDMNGNEFVLDMKKGRKSEIFTMPMSEAKKK
jgi:hypothetical protein